MTEKNITHLDGIATRLREERERLGMNQTEFSAIGGVSRRTQSGYETSATTIDLEYLARVAEVGADTVYILSGIRQNIEMLNLMTAYNSAPPAVRAAALAGLLAGAAPTQGVKQIIHGNVGQSVSGDLHLSGGQSFTFGEVKNKK